MNRKPHRSKAKPISGPVVVEDAIQTIAGVLVHPDTALLPLMSDEKLDALAADIKRIGQVEAVVYLRGEDGVVRLLDGRNRLRAQELIAKAEGRELLRASDGLPDVWRVVLDKEDVLCSTIDFVMSRNFHRRQLDADDSAKVIVRVAARYPEFSIRRLADVIGVSKSAVHRALQEEPVKPEPAAPEVLENSSAEIQASQGGTPDPQPKPEPAPQPKPEEPKRVIGKDGKSYSKKQPTKSKPTSQSSPAKKTIGKVTCDQAVVVIGAELSRRPRETIERFIKLMQGARGPVLDIGEPMRMELAMKFASALGFGPDDLLLHLNKHKAESQEKAA
jgi:ParB-like chromosome segregation protein Spo0J